MKENGSVQNLRERTKRYALRIIRMSAEIPKTAAGNVIDHQILKSGTSPGAHCREAAGSRSTAEFISKMEGGLQELDETAYWLELLAESGRLPVKRLGPLCKETDELISIFTSCVRNAKHKRETVR